MAFPPCRHSIELQEQAHRSFTIGRVKFSQAQMPETVIKPGGTKLIRPAKWRGTETDFGELLGEVIDSRTI